MLAQVGSGATRLALDRLGEGRAFFWTYASSRSPGWTRSPGPARDHFAVNWFGSGFPGWFRGWFGSTGSLVRWPLGPTDFPLLPFLRRPEESVRTFWSGSSGSSALGLHHLRINQPTSQAGHVPEAARFVARLTWCSWVGKFEVGQRGTAGPIGPLGCAMGQVTPGRDKNDVGVQVPRIQRGQPFGPNLGAH